MTTATSEGRDIVQARLLYTALIKAVLIAWTKGYPVAKPEESVWTISKDKEQIVRQIVGFFNSVPAPGANGLAGSYGHVDSIPDEAAQIAPVLEAIAELHRAVAHSGQKYAKQIAGETELETIKNLIAFFTDCPQ